MKSPWLKYSNNYKSLFLYLRLAVLESHSSAMFITSQNEEVRPSNLLELNYLLPKYYRWFDKWHALIALDKWLCCIRSAESQLQSSQEKPQENHLGQATQVLTVPRPCPLCRGRSSDPLSGHLIE